MINRYSILLIALLAFALALVAEIPATALTAFDSPAPPVSPVITPPPLPPPVHATPTLAGPPIHAEDDDDGEGEKKAVDRSHGEGDLVPVLLPETGGADVWPLVLIALGAIALRAGRLIRCQGDPK